MRARVRFPPFAVVAGAIDGTRKRMFVQLAG